MERSKRRFVWFLGLYLAWLGALGVLVVRSSEPPKVKEPGRAPAGASEGTPSRAAGSVAR